MVSIPSVLEGERQDGDTGKRVSGGGRESMSGRLGFYLAETKHWSPPFAATYLSITYNTTVRVVVLSEMSQ